MHLYACRYITSKARRMSMLTARSRPFWSSIGNLRAGLSTGPKNLQSYYDALGVTPAATQNDIKSAYYKLTLKYHPDRNKSEAAKEKFRSVTEAYEVLGNYRSRKRYDMGIRPTAGRHDSTPHDFPQDDAQTRFYKSRMQRSQPPTTTGRTPIYDFDEWSRAHYGATMNRRRETKARYEKGVRDAENFTNNKRVESVMTAICVSILIAYFWACFDRRGYDVDKLASKSTSSDGFQAREAEGREGA